MAIAPTAKTAASTKKVEKTSKPASAAKNISKNAPIAHGTGRRKSAVARVWLRKGAGSIVINGKDYNDYFTVPSANEEGKLAFNLFKITEGLSVDVNVQGGGFTAQSGAINLGVARALVMFDESLRAQLRQFGYLTVDSRVKERKKPGQRGARAKFQFTKR